MGRAALRAARLDEPFALVACDQQIPTKNENEKTHLDRISASQPLRQKFFSKVSASDLEPNAFKKESLQRLTVMQEGKKKGVAVGARLRKNTRKKIPSISPSEQETVSQSVIVYVPKTGDLFRVDESFNSEKETKYVRFSAIESKAKVVIKKTGEASQVVLSTGASTMNKNEDWTTGECIETTYESCSGDAVCAMMCAVLSPWCEAEIVVACAISANN